MSRSRNRRKSAQHKSKPAPEHNQALVSKKWLVPALAIVTIIALVFAVLKMAPEGSWLSFGEPLHLRTPFPEPADDQKRTDVVFADFVGAAACAECHEKEYKIWQQSTHGQAGGKPDKVNIIGRYKGQPLHYKDATVIPQKRDSASYSFAVQQNNRAPFEIKVDEVVGGGHMLGGGTQSYFSKFPDGTVRFLPFDYIKIEGVWFSQRRDNRNWDPDIEDLALDELSEWPPNRVLGTHEDHSNCQNCHGSQILLDYNPLQKTYETRYTELAINCESCHGPGRRHIEIMKSADSLTAKDIGLPALETLSEDESLNICFQCHAVKDAIDAPFLPGKSLEKHYALKLPILAQSPYLDDGRIRAFAYQLNHVASDCYLNGTMTCVDCHDPHSQAYRDINGMPLVGAFDNQQCLDCHISKAEAPEKHSYHKPDSPGNLCTSCHFPYLQHQMLGKKLRFARSDHTIPIPRPEFDARIGIENACSQCHKDHSVQWAQAKTEEWYGELKPHKDIVRALGEKDRWTSRQQAARALLDSMEVHPIAQATALVHFAKNHLRPDMPTLESDIIQKLQRYARQPDLDLKALALMSLHLAQGEQAEVHDFLEDELQKLGEFEVAVRKRWAIAVDFLGYLYSQQGDYLMAITAHRKALEIDPNEPTALVNLGLAYGNSGDLDKAIIAFERALTADPNYTMALKNLHIAYLQQGKIEQAIAALRTAVERKPVDPEAHVLLSQALLRNNNRFEALAVLQAARQKFPLDTGIQQALQRLSR